MAEGSSCATLLHLQGGHLGLVGHLSSDRGGTEHKNRNMWCLHAGTHRELGAAWAQSPQRRVAVAACGFFHGCALIWHYISMLLFSSIAILMPNCQIHLPWKTVHVKIDVHKADLLWYELGNLAQKWYVCLQGCIFVCMCVCVCISLIDAVLLLELGNSQPTTFIAKFVSLPLILKGLYWHWQDKPKGCCDV